MDAEALLAEINGTIRALLDSGSGKGGEGEGEGMVVDRELGRTNGVSVENSIAGGRLEGRNG